MALVCAAVHKRTKMALKFVVLVVFISMIDAGLIPALEVLQGPSSRTTLVGPDGSTLAAAAPGGTVVTGTHPGGLVAASPLALAASPDIVVAGPSGTIATSHTLAGPAIIPVAANTLLLGDIDSADGAYVPDNTEKLYDDGSYKDEQ